MWLWGLLQWVAGHHLIPAVLASVWIGLGLTLVFGVLRMRRASDRVPFLYAALLKTGLAAWTGESLSCLTIDPHRFGYFGLKLPDLIPSGSLSDMPVKSGPTDHWSLVVLAVAILASGLLLYRWSRVAPIYRRLSESRQARPRDFPDFVKVVQAFEDLVSKSFGTVPWLPRPQLMLLYEAPSPAFTMGVRPPVVVLSAELVSELDLDQVRGILAHELGHIRRWDYLARWLATMLRDVLIWNPFVYRWCRSVLEQQEKASDAYAADLTGKPQAVASGLVEMGAYLTGMAPMAKGPAGPVEAWGSRRDLQQLNERVDLLLRALPAPQPRFSSAGIARAAALLLFVLAQPHTVISVPYVYALIKRLL